VKLIELPGLSANAEVGDCDITGLENDSRQVKPGDLFMAYPGALSDGRNYIKQAVESGAAAILYDPVNDYSPAALSLQIPCIPVEQLASRLAGFASAFYRQPGHALDITAVTGTNGKTTIAYQLAQAHSLLGQAAAYIGTLGQGEVKQLKVLDNTTPDALCLQKLMNDYRNRQFKQVCMEVSSHALSQQRVDEIPFSQAIFTNLSHDHLDYHHNMQEYAAAKAKLFATNGLKWAIVNQDDEYTSHMLSSLKKGAKALSYAIHQAADVKVTHWHMDRTGTDLELDTPWGAQHIKIKALGEFNIYNCLAVFSSLMISGYAAEQVTAIMPQLQSAPGRLEVVWNNPLIIVDYAHTPDALKNVLITLNQLKTGHLWVVFGCGGDRDKSKRALMGQVASDYADKMIITSDNPRTESPESILDDIAEGIAVKDYFREADRKKAIEMAISQASSEDIVLIAGKGHEDYQIIGDVKSSFSDQHVVGEYFKSAKQL